MGPREERQPSASLGEPKVAAHPEQVTAKYFELAKRLDAAVIRAGRIRSVTTSARWPSTG
ncbi:hypothetical protein A4R43_09420 [Amycolatopsis albispora]|uniref:Uncharacterized protein n=1 Tax=Amycolatopsis albispora TaxID=1804986 RepID=A0A344L3U7_9PSEU|nr:hypothetical protein A4R43_09420 [Amycolatopsis albispora]